MDNSYHGKNLHISSNSILAIRIPTEEKLTHSLGHAENAYMDGKKAHGMSTQELVQRSWTNPY